MIPVGSIVISGFMDNLFLGIVRSKTNLQFQTNYQVEYMHMLGIVTVIPILNDESSDLLEIVHPSKY